MCDYLGDYKSSKKFSTPICEFLKSLKAGDDVDVLIIGGQNHNVDAFTSFDKKTGIATFVRNNGAVLVVGCDQIDAILIDE
ncbi:hypothetical protein [Bacillus toyonensis]|uniref:hypothetical protein n=1 Tax=Bacillus toyonensis TaxID=155322 RepID=UPI000B42D376|nr:hypothetical protein [Bacillus toyonensis]MED3202120.1 hypothetical protein [Bacillus toyonensis]OTX08899.1 hypothetical protein BK712_07850 [Bacillus thuringiensis serovar seoulensis]